MDYHTSRKTFFMNISILDWTIVIVYLAGVVGLGCWAGMNAKKKGQQQGESVAGDYFMAAHTLKWAGHRPRSLRHEHLLRPPRLARPVRL
jgi:hypothetical protein